MGLITEERFVELMEQIPVMHEKLDRLFNAFNEIIARGSLEGITLNEEEFPPIEFTQDKLDQDQQKRAELQAKQEEVRRMNQEINDIRDELGI